MDIGGGLVGIIIVLIVFGSIAAIVLGPIWFKERTKQSAHQLIAQALEKGQQLDPALMEKLTDAVQNVPNRARRTLGNGIVLVCLALGFGSAAYFSGDFDPSGHAMGGMMTIATILGALGVAFTLLAIVDYASKKKSGS